MKTQLFLHLLSLICCEGRGEGGDAGSWRGCLAENVEIPMDEEVEGVAGETLSREGDTFEVSKGEKEVNQEVHVEDASRGIEDFFRHALHGDTVHWNRSVAFINGMFTITIAVCNVVI